MDALVGLLSTAARKNELRAWFGACCLCIGVHQARSMAREVVKDELVVRRIVEIVLPKKDY